MFKFPLLLLLGSSVLFARRITRMHSSMILDVCYVRNHTSQSKLHNSLILVKLIFNVLNLASCVAGSAICGF